MKTLLRTSGVRIPSLFRVLMSLSIATFTAPAARAQPAPPAVPLPPAPPRPSVMETIAVSLAPRPDGLTADKVAKLASTTSFTVRTKQAELKAAAARVDQAFVGYFPRLTLMGSYTRLSPVNSSLGGAIVGAANPGPIVNGPCAPGSAAVCPTDSGGVPIQAATIAFPTPVNSYSFTAGLIVPISDYVLRTSQAYASASHSEKSKQLELRATALQVSADARAAFYNWLRAKGQVVVAADAVSQVQAHLEEANRTLRAGLISPADVVRLEAQVASAEQGVAEVEAFAAIAEQQLRTAIHAPEGEPLQNGADVLNVAMPAEPPPLEILIQQAMDRRLEIRALDETEYAFKDTESWQKAGYLPRLDAFADAVYANPNPRIFPAVERFDLTWDVGVRATFVLNDVGTAAAQSAEARARIASVAEQRGALRDGLRLEVASAYYDLKRIVSSIASAERGIAAATESARVRNELFKNGKATSVELIDAETELTRARLTLLDTRIGVLVAEARLAHATGADAGGDHPGP